MKADELKYWVAFTRLPRVGRVSFQRMEEHFGTLEQAWRAGLTELRAAGLDQRAARNIATRKMAVDPDGELAALEKAGVRAVTWHHDDYPPRLKEVYDRPPLIFVRGDILPEDERSVAVVGTRSPSPYGR